MTVKFVMIFVMLFPPKPDMSLRFKDISITSALASAKLVGIKLDLPFKLEGRIASLVVEVRGQIVTVHAKGIAIQGDPVRWVQAVYHRRTEAWYVKAEALGGLVELEGIIPK